ncbi:hypothetical protein AAIR98_001352 [Elusimicrobium simillimum]|uniref:cyclophilin-like fold protein n=1 Tax=Elusimicrobium simillimum TaxID=3143438 RepID=UPI003C6F4209
MQIKFILGENVLSAAMNNTKTARDFLALLPQEVTLTDYAQKEKIFNLPSRLSTEGAPSGAKPKAGDIAYYAPWGNIAIFYKDAPYADGLIIGHVANGLNKFEKAENDFTIRIERVENN